MYFENVQYLYFLPLTALPLIIYLIFRKKPQKLVFSSLFLLKIIAKNVNRRTKIKDILLLIIRTLIVLFLIFLFARPFIGDKIAFDQGKKTAAVIYIDSSPSMADDFSGISKFDTAKNLLIKTVNSAPDNTMFYLITSDPGEKFKGSKKDALKYLSSLEIYGRERIFDEVIIQSDSILSGVENSNKLFMVLTDGYINFKKEPESSVGYLKKAVLFYSDHNKSGDISLDSVQMAGRNYLYFTLLSNEGKSTRTDIYQDGRKIYSENKEFADDFFKRSSIELQDLPNDEITVRAEISDDINLLNNSYNFVLPRLDKKKILIVGDNNSVSVRRIFSLIKASSDSVLIPETVNPADINSVKFTDFSLVFFDDMPKLNSYTVSGLKSFIGESGGSVYFSGGEKLNLNDYNSNLVPVLQFPRISGYEKSSGSFVNIKIKDKKHPVFKDVFGENISNAGSVEIYNFYKVEKNGWTSLIDAGNSPLLLEKTYGKGKMFFLTTSLDQNNSNIIGNGIAVPILFNSFLYLIGNEIANEISRTVGDFVEFNENCYLIEPGKDFNAGLDEMSKKFFLKKPGFYKVYDESGRYIKKLAVNYERENFGDHADLIRKYYNSTVVKNGLNKDIGLISFESKDLSVYLLILILILICAEILLVRVL